ncbi:hypothetical protein ABID95_007947 [Streptomyces atratus]
MTSLLLDKSQLVRDKLWELFLRAVRKVPVRLRLLQVSLFHQGTRLR